MQVPSDFDIYGRQLQVAVSDYVLNSTIFSLYRQGYLEGDTSNVNGTSYGFPVSYLFYVFPQLSGKYKGDENIYVRIKAKSDQYVPYMSIVNGVTTAYVDLDLAIRTEKEILLELDSNVQLEVNVMIGKGFKLTIDVRMLKIKVREILVNNIDPSIDERDISSFIGFASGFARNYVNRLVKNYEITLPFGDSIDLKDISLSERHHHIFADVTPTFNLVAQETE